MQLGDGIFNIAKKTSYMQVLWREVKKLSKIKMIYSKQKQLVFLFIFYN
jgi:hypothetical protein